MPDRLCKTSYECELQFNMFRRRHHCRFCGQVFCHSCASYFVDGKSVFLSGMVRACKLCHDQVTSIPVAISRVPHAANGSQAPGHEDQSLNTSVAALDAFSEVKQLA